MNASLKYMKDQYQQVDNPQNRKQKAKKGQHIKLFGTDENGRHRNKQEQRKDKRNKEWYGLK